MKETVNPQHLKFKQAYLDPKGATFGNVSGSLQYAGYSKSYADNATALKPDWLYKIIGTTRRARLYEKAEKNLEETLNIIAIDNEGKVDTNILRIQTDVSKFVAKGIGKEDYSERTELTGENGAPLNILFDKSFDNEK